MAIDLHQAREFLADRERFRQQELDRRFELAWKDFRAIVDLIARRYRPRRIYQWGSLLDRSRFASFSDIDVAIEGIIDPAKFSRLFGDADRLTAFPLDLVAMERIEPEFADLIRLKGKLVCECEPENLPVVG